MSVQRPRSFSPSSESELRGLISFCEALPPALRDILRDSVQALGVAAAPGHLGAIDRELEAVKAEIRKAYEYRHRLQRTLTHLETVREQLAKIADPDPVIVLLNSWLRRRCRETRREILRTKPRRLLQQKTRLVDERQALLEQRDLARILTKGLCSQPEECP